MVRDQLAVVLDSASEKPSRLGQLAYASPSSPQGVHLIPIASIRTDGNAQNRTALNPDVIREYADLMRAGVDFPPIAVRFDGAEYWPSDGFQRLAAAKIAECADISAEVHLGTREDAQWDSYSANATHGLRRTPAETERVIVRALQHANAANLSNVQLAKHLHIPLTTLHRYRRQFIISTGEDGGTRSVRRGDTTYEMNVTRIGKKRTDCRTRLRRSLQSEIAEMKARASAPAVDLLNVIEKWTLGQVPPTRCIGLVENILRRAGIPDHR